MSLIQRGYGQEYAGWRADPQGKPAIAHGSKVKVRLQHPGGWFVDRVPAWIRWATVEPNKMGAKYDGIFWDPPASERHAWWAHEESHHQEEGTAFGRLCCQLTHWGGV